MPSVNWAQLFLTIDRLTPEGTSVLRLTGRGDYLLNLNIRPPKRLKKYQHAWEEA